MFSNFADMSSDACLTTAFAFMSILKLTCLFSFARNLSFFFEFQLHHKHAVSDRITDELIAVYGLLDSFLKSESDSKKKRSVCCMSCSFRNFETEPDFSLQHVFSHVVADMYLTC